MTLNCFKSEWPNKVLHATYLPPLRSVKYACKPGRWA